VTLLVHGRTEKFQEIRGNFQGLSRRVLWIVSLRQESQREDQAASVTWGRVGYDALGDLKSRQFVRRPLKATEILAQVF
jgi:hypothetical protein